MYNVVPLLRPFLVLKKKNPHFSTTYFLKDIAVSSSCIRQFVLVIKLHQGPKSGVKMILNSFVVEPDVLYLLLRFAGQNLYIDIKTYVVGIRVSIQTVSRQRGKQLSHAF